MNDYYMALINNVHACIRVYDYFDTSVFCTVLYETGDVFTGQLRKKCIIKPISFIEYLFFKKYRRPLFK